MRLDRMPWRRYVSDCGQRDQGPRMRIAPTLHRQPPRRYVITAIRLAAGVRMPVRPRRSALALFGLLSFSLSALPCAGQEVVPPSVYASPQQLIAVDGAPA